MDREVSLAGYAVGRLGGALLVWLLVSFIAFSLGTVAPGDPAQLMLLRRTGDAPSDAEVRALRAELGLDRPFIVRYRIWLTNAVRGDFGTSYRTGRPVLDDLRERMGATLWLAVTSLAIGIVIAVPLAVVAARRRDGPADYFARLVALAGVSIPSYLVAYVLTLILSVQLGWFPVMGGRSGNAAGVMLPALTLGIGSAASLARLLRGALLDELGSDYVRQARAKGRDEWGILTHHALRNAVNPVVTVGALRFGRLLGEAAVVESVFAWPGIGMWVVSAIYDRDYPAIQGFVLYIATLFTAINLLVDFSYRALDPRVRLGARAA